LKQVPQLKFLQEKNTEGKVTSAYTEDIVKERNPWLGEPKYFIMDSKPV
jgi:hypothetical protein